MEDHLTVGVALGGIYEKPARAITQNALIIALGFAPMFFASLTPSIVAGEFMVSFMALSWVVSLALLPSVISLFEGRTVQETEA
ncbi:MAG: hypothetical protein BZY87_08375 [SAR202 cluster bacterium Io17-Chloro-G6]|nr:MAG: hypothetical protein BZY87_08375 [SAR202 cluster bacterium Io17-Chloro-G6]